MSALAMILMAASAYRERAMRMSRRGESAFRQRFRTVNPVVVPSSLRHHRGNPVTGCGGRHSCRACPDRQTHRPRQTRRVTRVERSFENPWRATVRCERMALGRGSREVEIMRRNNLWRERVFNVLCGLGIAVLAAVVLFILCFRAASMIDPRRPDDYDEMILFLTSHSFLMIPCAVFVLLGINLAIFGGIRLFRREAPDGGLPGAWKERAAVHDGFRAGSRTTANEDGIIPARSDDGNSSADAFSLKRPLD